MLTDRLMSEVEGLGKHEPLAHTTPVLRAALDQAEDVESLRWLLAHAMRVSNFDIALVIDELIPGAARAPDDDINRCLLVLSMGRFAEACRDFKRIPRADLDELDEALLLLNWVPCRMYAETHLPPDELRELLAFLTRAETLLGTRAVTRAVRKPDRALYLAVIEQARGLCALRLGDAHAAVVRLHKAVRLDDTNPWIFLSLGDVHAATGDQDAARSAWRRCAEEAHPESFLGRTAHQRLGSIFR